MSPSSGNLRNMHLIETACKAVLQATHNYCIIVIEDYDGGRKP